MLGRFFRSTRFAFVGRRYFCSKVEYREEKDTFGPIKVRSDRLWAAQTQRSIENFDIARDTDRMPKPIIRAFGILKKSAAIVNLKYGLNPKTGKYFPIQLMSLSKLVMK